jgi:hypothetical protein
MRQSKELIKKRKDQLKKKEREKPNQTSDIKCPL